MRTYLFVALHQQYEAVISQAQLATICTNGRRINCPSFILMSDVGVILMYCINTPYLSYPICARFKIYTFVLMLLLSSDIYFRNVNEMRIKFNVFQGTVLNV